MTDELIIRELVEALEKIALMAQFRYFQPADYMTVERIATNAIKEAKSRLEE